MRRVLPHRGGPFVECGVGHNESMCGRYVMSKATGDLLSQFEAKEIEGSPPPSWNVAPTQDVPIIAERLDEGSVYRPQSGRAS
jgi:putative SOS response-associated peptidase YedK